MPAWRPGFVNKRPEQHRKRKGTSTGRTLTSQVPKLMAQDPKMETISSIRSVVLDILKVQAKLSRPSISDPKGCSPEQLYPESPDRVPLMEVGPQNHTIHSCSALIPKLHYIWTLWASAPEYMPKTISTIPSIKAIYIDIWVLRTLRAIVVQTPPCAPRDTAPRSLATAAEMPGSVRSGFPEGSMELHVTYLGLEGVLYIFALKGFLYP